MTSPLPTRSRWVRCCIVSVSIASATIYWRHSRSLDKNDDIDLVSRSSISEEAELAPTLANAQEIHPIQTPGLVANSTWNPEPNWNPAWTIEQLPRPSSSLANSTPIPDTFPLEPRVKKEPPAIGEAFASFPNSPMPSTPLSSTKASPFGSAIAVASPQEQTIHQAQRATISTPPTLPEQKPNWPDQTFASDEILPNHSTAQSDRPTTSNELATPHLLTGLEVRLQQRPSKPAPTSNPSSGFSIKPNQPSAGNYILQPMRDPPK